MIGKLKKFLGKVLPGLFKKKKNVKIGLYGPPNAGKCVTPDTRIVLQNGEVKTIKEVFDQVSQNEGVLDAEDYEERIIQVMNTDLLIPSLDIDTLNIIPKKVSFVYSQRYKGDIYNITTRNGRNIRVTPVHPLIRISDNGVEKIRAQDLQKGESVAICKNLELSSSLTIPEVSMEAFEAVDGGMVRSKRTYHNPKAITTPKVVDSKLVRFVAYTITESNHTKGKIVFSNKDKDLLKDFTMLSGSLFNLQPTARKREDKSAYELDLSSVSLIEFLENNLGLAPALSGDKKIPASFMGMPKSMTAELLQVLFDCEGSVEHSRIVRGKEIEYSSKSKVLVEQVQLLLNRFGIVGKINRKPVKGKDYWRLIISGSDQHILFRDNIGFKTDYKQERLNELCRASLLKRNKFSLPIMNKLDSIRKDMGLLQREFFLDSKHIARMKRDNRITYHRLAKMAKVVDNEFVRKVANADTMWDEIKSIKKETYDGYVYDLTIEDTHTFLAADGLVAHNTTLANRICEDWLGEGIEMGKASSIAHETREIQTKENIVMKKNGKSLSFNLIDTPGIATKIDYEDFLKHKMSKKVARERAKEATKGVIEAIKWLDDMDCVVVVLDSTTNPYSQVNITIIGNLAARDVPVLIAANKTDLKKSNIKKVESAFPQYKVIGISAGKGTNVDELYEELFELVK